VTALRNEVAEGVGRHPDAEIVTSRPGLGAEPRTRVLAELGDDCDRYVDAKARNRLVGILHGCLKTRTL
jgi:hypothetical protein